MNAVKHTPHDSGISVASEITFSSKTLGARRWLAQVRRCRCAIALSVVILSAQLIGIDTRRARVVECCQLARRKGIQNRYG